jgi:Putative peptidoglycan binding domain
VRLLIFFGLAVMVMVPINALFLQEGRHPAPLFHLAALEPDTLRVDAPLPPTRPAAPAAPKPEAAKPAPAKTDTAQKADSGDLIADLIEGRLPKTEAKPPHQGKDAIGDQIAHAGVDNKTVLFAQHALVKLGYVLHQDGVFGGTTRQAIEMFERANHLPVTGELSPKLVKLLSQRSGVAAR